MKFKVSCGDLERRLSVLGRVIESKPAVPVWGHFLFETKGDSLIVTAGSSDVVMQTELSVMDSESDAKAVVPGGKVMEYLKKLPEQPIEISIDEVSHAIQISTLMGTSTQTGDAADEWPAIPELSADAQTITASSQSLLNGIARTTHAVANDPLRPAMNGIFFDVEPTMLTLVSTDSHRLVRYCRTDIQPGINASFILNKRPAALLKSVLDKVDSTVNISFDRKYIVFQMPLFTMVCLQPEGAYPAYRSVIPANGNPYKLTVNRQDFANAVSRVLLFSDNTKLLRLDVSSNSINISSQDLDLSCKASETISCDYSGDDMTIGFKGAFFFDVLANMECQELEISLADPARSALFSPALKRDGEDELMLLMPMKV
ncbi:MAG: DNA polymerase III subunit beta [Bacteroidales bacterium]|nr:DNA polymerase III subunit beta [Bacteroidales bacterium]